MTPDMAYNVDKLWRGNEYQYFYTWHLLLSNMPGNDVGHRHLSSRNLRRADASSLRLRLPEILYSRCVMPEQLGGRARAEALGR